MKWEELRNRVVALLEKLVNDPTTPMLIRQISQVTMEGLALASIMGDKSRLKTASYAECLTKVEQLEKTYDAVAEQVAIDDVTE